MTEAPYPGGTAPKVVGGIMDGIVGPTLRQVKEAVRHPYTSLGGYALRFYCTDGDAICTACVKAEWRNIVESTIGHNYGWRIGALGIHWEGPADNCVHCNKELPSEHGDPEADDE